MDDAGAGDGPPACPHIDRDDRRCSSRFCLSRIEQALGVCFGAYHACPMFHEINAEIEAVAGSSGMPPLIVVTANGCPVSRPASRSVPLPVPLRPTGT
jgi:hypothetical protein